jgi:hypothetical protein
MRRRPPVLEGHAAAIEGAIRSCAVVIGHELTTVRLSPNTGYVQGEISLIDGSRLTFFVSPPQASAWRSGIERSTRPDAGAGSS